MILCDFEGNLAGVSLSIKEVLGHTSEDLIGKNLDSFIYSSDIPDFKHTIEKIKRGASVPNSDFRVIDSKRKIIKLNWSFSLLPSSNQIFVIARKVVNTPLGVDQKKADKINLIDIFDHTADLLWSVDRDFNLVKANYTFFNILRKSKNWKIKTGENLLNPEFLTPEKLEKWKTHYSKALSGEKVKLQSFLEFPSEDKQLVFETIISPIKNKEGVVGLVCSSRDITDQHKFTKKIQKLNKRLNKSQELSKLGYLETNLETNQVFWSDEMYKIWGLKKSFHPVSLDIFLESIHPKDRSNFLYHRDRALLGEKKLDLVFRIITSKGKTKYVHELGEIVRLADTDQNVFRGTIQEVTKSKIVEEKLKERNFFIEAIIENLPTGIAVNKISTGEVTYLNKAFEEIYGWPKEEISDIVAFFNKIHPEKKHKNGIKERIFGDIKSGDSKKMIWTGLSIQTKKGTEKIINAKNIILPDLDLMISTVTDDTERFKSKRELKISNNRFTLVSEAVSDAIWDWDIEKSTIYWGRGYHTIFGYPESQTFVDESAWYNSIHPEDLPEIWESITKTRENKETKYWSGEYRFKRWNGTYAYVNEKTIILRNELGEPIRMVGAIHDITQEKNRENSLNLLESVVTQTQDAILVTLPYSKKNNLKIIYCNPSFLKMTGFYKNEIIGKTPKILFGNDSDQKVLKSLIDKLKKGISHEFELINYTKKGTPFWVSLTLSPVRDETAKITHWIWIQRNITDQKQKEIELKLMNDRFKLVTEAAEVAIWDWDIQTKNHYWGEGFEKVFGINLSNKENDPREWANRIHPDDQEYVLSYLNNILQDQNTKTFTIQYRFKKTDGSFAYVSDSGIVIRNEKGQPLRLVGAMQNVSKQKEIEFSLRTLNENLEKSNRELEISNQELEQFAYVASHDLQEPLRMISSFLGLIERRYHSILDEKGNQYIQFAVNGANRMRKIILDLLEFSNLENFQEAKTWENPRDLIDTSLLFLKKELRSKNPQIQVGSLPKIFVLKNSLIQVFQNLISNAIIYQPEDQRPTVSIDGHEFENYWEFCIEDNGIGIDQEDLEKIFILFKRLHRQDRYSGTGIGLSICKKVIEIHEGTLKVESEIGKGSKFFFTIKKPNEV